MSHADEYIYTNAQAPWLEKELWPALNRILAEEYQGPKRLFEVGCGNGATAHMLSRAGYDVVGIDPSESGIKVANKAYPDLMLKVGSAYDDPAAEYGVFPLVISLEVIEHCYSPFKYIQAVYRLLDDGGVAVISTPYHGYLKNLAISVLGKWDNHWRPLWEHGHIKFFSEKTIGRLIRAAGFSSYRIHRVGRIRPLAKSMMIVARK